MTGKERIRAALEHTQPDRVPLDFGGCAQTTIHVEVIAALRQYYGLENRPVKVEEPYTMMGRLDEDLKKILEIDVDSLNPKYSFFGIPRDQWKEYRMNSGLEVLVPKDMNVTVDEDGRIFMHPKGDIQAEPSAVMPKDGYYFDAIMRQKEINDDTLTVEDNLEEFTLISEEELVFLQEQLPDQRKSGRALMGVVPGAGLGDIALVPAPWLENPKGIRDIEEWYISTLTRRDFLHELFERQTDIALKNLELIFQTVGNEIDVAWVCGTDFGTQTSTFCSLETFTELYAPYYKKVNNWIHRHTSWKTFKHCCGAMESLMQAFIECGFDIMNPVQWTTPGMDPAHLKKTYGSHITFWGGGVDTQYTLPFGTPEQVREEVLKTCEIFAPGGGFVFSSIHNIQANTPTENVIAMFDALREFNGKG